MPEPTNLDRRRFLGVAAAALAAGDLCATGSADAQPGRMGPVGGETTRPGRNASFGPLKQVDAGVLNAGTPKTAPPTAPR